jgi:serine/threonine protein kinase/Flp pilus assembly protein TadD
LDTLVCEAIEIADADARAAYLRRACGDDPVLRQQVESLVVAHFQAGGFLEHPACPPVRTAPYAPSPGEAALAQLSEGPGTLIGPYKLLERIGEGGMGAVYVAEQTQPVRRRVAVKVIKPGMDSKEVVARFEAERQALALMDHPHIAKVLDAGATQAGRPYFVMELVRGLPITAYCDQARLPAERLLRLFAQVCRAIQHAHQKGIIHRDLKPSNVLVTLHDGEPVPKVIDFGVAKALNQRLADKTVYTRLTQLVGTPLYMSPEQAELSALDVDTRSDVYSLGVLLYELLTGTTPFDPETIRQAGFDEMRRMIREDEPPRPSQRVSTLGAQARSTLSARRGLDDRRLSRLLRGDLDWIAMKALEKDRNRRYESAGAFADDVERYLADEPVVACPPSAAYRLRKFARRNRAALATAAVLGAAVLAVAGSLGWTVRDVSARRRAAEQAAAVALDESAEHHTADRAEAARAAARRAVDTLAGVRGADVLRAAAEDRVAELRMATRLEDIWLDALGDGRSNPPDVSMAAYHAAFREFGLDPTELSEAAAVERIRGRLIAPQLAAALDGWEAYRRVVAGPSDPLAATLRAIAAEADPDPWSRRVRDTIHAGTPEQLVALAAEFPVEAAPPEAAGRLGRALDRLAQKPAGEALLRRAAGAYPGDVHITLSLADLLRDSPVEAARLEALGFYRAALAVRPHSPAVMSRIGSCLTDRLGRPQDGAEVFRDLLRRHPNFTLARHNLVVALEKQGKDAEALEAAREAAAVAPSVMTYGILGRALSRAGRAKEAAEAHRRAVRFEPRSAMEHFQRGRSLSNLGQKDEAIAAFREALRLYPRYSHALHYLGDELSQKGAYDEAWAAYREALRHAPARADTHNSIGVMHMRRGRWDDALAAYQVALRLDPAYPEAWYHLGNVLSVLNRPDEAAAAYREAVRLRPGYADAHYNLGVVLGQLQRKDEAEGAYREAIRLNPGHAQAHCNLAQFLHRQGRYAEALAAFRRGHEEGSRSPSWPYPSAYWVERAERVVALQPRLPAILAGTDDPADPADALAAAAAAGEQDRNRRAAELYRAAFAKAPALARDPKLGLRFGAACAAARAGSGAGDDTAALDAAGRAAWRRQALAWLREELAMLGKQLADGTPGEWRIVLSRLGNVQRDSDLAGVRDDAALAKLPEAERAEWAQFWADVGAVRAKRGGPP